MVDINNPSSYKSCTEKQYEVWVCKPPIGTIVFNKLDHAQAIVKLKQISPKGLKCDKGYLWFAPPSKSDEVGMQTYNSLVSFIGQSKQGYLTVVNYLAKHIQIYYITDKWIDLVIKSKLSICIWRLFYLFQVR